MSGPKTLLEMAGAPNRPQRLADSAVVMIDAQLEYVTGRLPLAGVGPALEVGAGLLAAARGAGRPVIHVQHRGKGDGLFGPDSAFFAIAPEVVPVAGEPVVEKVVPNAFADGALDAKLKGLGVSKIIIGGFMTLRSPCWARRRVSASWRRSGTASPTVARGSLCPMSKIPLPRTTR